jgi:hypothetical protein
MAQSPYVVRKGPLPRTSASTCADQVLLETPLHSVSALRSGPIRKQGE